MNDLWHIAFPWWHFLLRGAVVYVAVIFLLRLSGKRQVAQMGIAQFVALLLISNAVQNAMNGGDNSLLGGLILAAVIILLSYAFSVLTYNSKDWENFIQGRPTLLIHHGLLLRENMRREMLNLRELRVLLRKQGVHDIHEVEEAVLESDGFISITRKSEIGEKIESQVGTT